MRFATVAAARNCAHYDILCGRFAVALPGSRSLVFLALAGLGLTFAFGIWAAAVEDAGALASAAQQAAAGGLIPPTAVAPFIGATPGLDSSVSIRGWEGLTSLSR